MSAIRRAYILALVMPIAFTFGVYESVGESPPRSPTLPPEMEILARWHGTWRVEARRRTPLPRTITYTETFQWVLDGQFLRSETSHKSDGTESMSIFTYDANNNSYRLWTFDSQGFAIELPPGVWDEHTGTMEWRGGIFSPVRFTGRATFVDTDTIHWSYVLKDWLGRLVFDVDGTSIRLQ